VKRLTGNTRRLALALAVSALGPPASAQDAGRDQAAIEAGEAVYNNYCQTCHGDRLVSTGQTFDLRRLTAGDRARFENSVRNGKNQMPPWKDVLGAEEIGQLWAYIRANGNQK
jgi:mono/diheme cytochrome c family protein